MRKMFFRGVVCVAIVGSVVSALSSRLLFAQETTPPAKRAHPGSAAGPTPKKHAAIADPEVIDPQGFARILAKYRGKPLLVNFWATWCEPCRDEYPLLNELAKKYAPQGLQVLGISLDDDGEMILVRRFLTRYKPIFPNFRKPPGKETEFISVVNQKWNGSIPASFFYARDGRQIGQIIGEGKRDIFEAAIRSVLVSGAKDSAALPSGNAGNYRGLVHQPVVNEFDSYYWRTLARYPRKSPDISRPQHLSVEHPIRRSDSHRALGDGQSPVPAGV